ncbi:tonsoku-like protein [Chelonus insularis]|uniref:tonsoku-like protein n=1 Tax=Chelonus insularis TaxID=460826 RepID=UPI00158B609F|nr:tonsoku-like protein [Chelonus insularis]
MDEEKLKKRKQRAQKDGNFKQQANIVKELGDMYYQAERMEEALTEYTEQLELCEKLEDKLNIALAHRMIGEIHTYFGNYEEALSHQTIYLESAKEMDSLVEQQRAYATLGRTYFCLGEASEESSNKRDEALNDAKRAYTKSLKLCDKLENTNINRVEIMMMRARLLLNLGLVLEVQKEPKRAVELIEEATELCQKHKLNDDLYRIHTALGALYERQEDFDNALKYYNLSGQITNDSINFATARVNEAELLTKLGRWSEARKILVPLYVNHNVPSLRENITRLLKIVASIDKYELELCTENDNKKIIMLYESLGDTAVAGLCYEKAVEYYKKMLDYAEKEPLVYRKKISAALVSLAQTLMDDKCFEEALVYARRELELSSNDDRENCRSALFLANLLTNIKESSDEEIRNVYQLALSSASNTQDISLQITVLKEMYEYLCDIHDMDEAEEVNKKLTALKMKRIGDSESSNNSEADESIDTIVDIDLDQLSDVECELQKKGEKSKSTRRPLKRGYVIKRNEKGETKLHVASINNNIEEVKSLLAAGHPVDVRDYCGWTPLHEASNYGYVEITELLIEHGANINDPGGSQCGNITPLHDAASCGNFAIINLLISRGADITLKTKAGETILDCLEKWKLRLEEDRKKNQIKWTDEDEKEYKLIRDKLRRVLPANSDKLLEPIEPLIDEDICSQKIDNNYEEKSPERISAGEDYKRTIESLKNRSYLNPIVNSSKLQKNNSSHISKTPLIDSEQQLVDDWLEDDIFMPSSTTTTGTLKRTRSDDNDTPLPKRKSFGSSTVSTFSDKKYFRKHHSDDSKSLNNKSSNHKSSSTNQTKKSLVRRKKQKSLFTAGFIKTPSTKPSNTPEPLPITINSVENDFTTRSRINTDSIHFRVIIDDLTMNIKIKNSDEHDYLFKCLTYESNKQFHQNTGCTAKMIFFTADGEELQADNLLNLVFTSQGSVIQLHGQLIDLVIPKITERYKTICTFLNVDIDNDDSKQLKPFRVCENSEVLRLRDENENINATALFKSLKYEKNLKVLDLSSYCLYNTGEFLNSTLFHLSQLEELHLSGCDIDSKCISKIEKLPPLLRILDLSYNPIGFKNESKLNELLTNLRFLQILNLRSCQLKKLPFHAKTISSNLINLDISWNVMNDTDIDVLLQRQLITLNLSQTHSRLLFTNDIRLIALETLETLDLGGCNINDSDVSYLLDKCKNLSKLILNNNPEISHSSLENLLEYKPTLSLIDITGCKKIYEEPRFDLSIDNPSICTMMACISSEVIEWWELLWRGHSKQYRMPSDIVVFKPFV